MTYEILLQLTALLAALAAASERLVETAKALVPGLQETTDADGKATKRNTKADRKREGVVSVLSLVFGFVTVVFGYWAGVFPAPLDSMSFPNVLLLGVMTAGGTRLWNPIVEVLKAIKDAKKG